LAIAILMTAIPYRIAWQRNEFPRARYADMRCYVLGQDAPNLLLYCPESTAPRTVTVPSTDRRVRLEGFDESIFVPADKAAQPPS
jgi:hypothetical protein